MIVCRSVRTSWTATEPAGPRTGQALIAGRAHHQLVVSTIYEYEHIRRLAEEHHPSPSLRVHHQPSLDGAIVALRKSWLPGGEIISYGVSAIQEPPLLTPAGAICSCHGNKICWPKRPLLVRCLAV